jgi:hypothetical protein
MAFDCGTALTQPNLHLKGPNTAFGMSIGLEDASRLVAASGSGKPVDRQGNRFRFAGSMTGKLG